jgi:hypothetical protein
VIGKAVIVAEPSGLFSALVKARNFQTHRIMRANHDVILRSGYFFRKHLSNATGPAANDGMPRQFYPVHFVPRLADIARTSPSIRFLQSAEFTE